MARARSFGNIRKLPSGRYQARYWHLGKQIPADTTLASKTDARRWLATIEADMFSDAMDTVRWRRCVCHDSLRHQERRGRHSDGRPDREHQ